MARWLLERGSANDLRSDRFLPIPPPSRPFILPTLVGVLVPQVYVVGEIGIQEELDLVGVPYIGGPEDGDKKIDLSPGNYMEHDKDVRATAPFPPALSLPRMLVVGPVCFDVGSGRSQVCWCIAVLFMYIVYSVHGSYKMLCMSHMKFLFCLDQYR